MNQLAYAALSALLLSWVVSGYYRDVVKPEMPPTFLTEQQKQMITEKARLDMLSLQLEYNVKESAPARMPIVQFQASLTNDRAAESYCEYTVSSIGRIEVNEPIAANNFHAFMSETIPHEVAHLLLCQLGGDWRAHGAEWETAVRMLNAEPKPTHAYLEQP